MTEETERKERRRPAAGERQEKSSSQRRSRPSRTPGGYPETCSDGSQSVATDVGDGGVARETECDVELSEDVPDHFANTRLARDSDLIIVAPATADLLARMAGAMPMIWRPPSCLRPTNAFSSLQR